MGISLATQTYINPAIDIIKKKQIVSFANNLFKLDFSVILIIVSLLTLTLYSLMPSL
jgi:hypothetical protein